MNKVWSFELGRVLVTLSLEQESNYQYDGCDEDGETQAKLDSGEFVAFTSRVCVEIDGEEMGADYLGGSVYAFGTESTFWSDHRTSAPAWRNTLANKAQGRLIGHYFPGMVSEAIGEARRALAERESA